MIIWVTDLDMLEALFATVEAIFDYFHNFHKINRYLQGHNSIELVLTL